MNKYKEDVEEAKLRMSAWWDHEPTDKPALAYYYPNPNKVLSSLDELIEYFDPWYLAQHWNGIQECLDQFESFTPYIHFGGVGIPRFFPNYGPGIMAAVLGVTPKFQTRTMWFHRDTSIHEVVSLLESAEPNMNNEWYARLLRITEDAVKKSNGDYTIAITDIGGVLDILASFLGPTKLILAMKKHPEIIDTCRQIILEKTLKVQKDLHDIIRTSKAGFNCWMNVWCPKPWYPIQCDFSAFLSPEWFKRFVLPDIIAQSESLDYSIYHLDGPDALKHLDALLEVDGIDAIQWVPGAGKELVCSDTWMPIYKKIQAAGKGIVEYPFENPEPLGHFYKELGTTYFYTFMVFMDQVKAQFYLPRSLGGEGGEGDFKKFRRELRKKAKN